MSPDRSRRGRSQRTPRRRRIRLGPAVLTGIVASLIIGPGIVSTAASTLVVASRSSTATSFRAHEVSRPATSASDARASAAPTPTPAPTPSSAPTPPPAPAAPVQDPRGPATTLAATERGVALSWAPPASAPAASYTITRTAKGLGAVVVATLTAATTSFLDISVTPGVPTAYSVAAQDAAGTTLGISLPLSTTPAAVSSGSGRRYGNCPGATVGVTSAAELAAALTSVSPGSVIRLAPGTYTGEFVVGGSGSPRAPVWICGPRSAVITSGSPSNGHAITVDREHDIVLAGFSISRAFKGVTIIESQRITATDLLVEQIGYEAIHLRKQTTASEVTFNTIRSTGLTQAEFGEGVYLGTSESNWCAYNNCAPDATSGIRVFGNVIFDTGAQAIEAKPGTSGGVIAANTMTGGRAQDGWVTVKGNGWLVADNVGTTSISHGYATNASVAGWGRDNIFTRNTASGTAKYGIWIHKLDGRDTLGNRVSCLETTTGTAAGAMNVGCDG